MLKILRIILDKWSKKGFVVIFIDDIGQCILLICISGTLKLTEIILNSIGTPLSESLTVWRHDFSSWALTILGAIQVSEIVLTAIIKAIKKLLKLL